MRLQNKVILVTASTRGIGLAIVEKCAREGAAVYMAARNLKRAQEVADKLLELVKAWEEERVCLSSPAR
jgi:NAD(P)-dependent dehydrogenase (short-subunit alcohol dehydrogenase family)